MLRNLWADEGDLNLRIFRSRRRTGRCEEVHLNPAYRWFCRLGLKSEVPEHSTVSKNRHGRFRDSDRLRHVFEPARRALGWLAGLSRRVPFSTGVVLIVLGLWSVGFGLFVSLEN